MLSMFAVPITFFFLALYLQLPSSVSQGRAGGTAHPLPAPLPSPLQESRGPAPQHQGAGHALVSSAREDMCKGN